MRFVLDSLIHTSASTVRSTPPALKEVYEIARTALSTPPRNCDRFANANEALEAFAKEKGETLIEFVRWLFA